MSAQFIVVIVCVAVAALYICKKMRDSFVAKSCASCDGDCKGCAASRKSQCASPKKLIEITPRK